LTKGRKVYVEGRLQTRSWNAQDGTPRSTTEIVISDMIILDPKGAAQASAPAPDFDISQEASAPIAEKKPESKKESKKESEVKEEEPAPTDEDEEIPF